MLEANLTREPHVLHGWHLRVCQLVLAFKVVQPSSATNEICHKGVRKYIPGPEWQVVKGKQGAKHRSSWRGRRVDAMSLILT